MTTKLMRVYGVLREEILDGHLAPGERLILHDLAARLGVSPIPVREALRLLERDDLVEIQPHTRVAVKALPPEEALWAAELRGVLEPVAARDAAERVGDHDLANAARALAELRLWLETDHAPGYLASYAEFHDVVLAATPNRRLARAVTELRLVSRRFRAVYREESLARGTERDLTAVYQALEARDKGAAFASMRTHCRRSLAHLRERLAGAAASVTPAPGAERGGGTRRRPTDHAQQLDPLIKLW